MYETESAFAFLDINPVNEYHTLVIPKQHFTNIFDVPAETLTGVITALKHVVEGDGQDIKWATHREMREQFDELLKRLRE